MINRYYHQIFILKQYNILYVLTLASSPSGHLKLLFAIYESV